MSASTVVSARPHCAPPKSQLCSVGEAARIMGVSVSTVRNHLSRGELEGYTLRSGHRRLLRRSVIEASGGAVEDVTEKEIVIVYGRTSTHRQANDKKTGSSDLSRQISRLEKIAKERYPDRELVTIKDVGSGMNFEKPGLDRLITGMLNGEFKGAKLLCEHKDRLARWAVPIIQKIADHAEIEIEYVEQGELGDEEMLVNDLLAITTIFSAKLYGKRGSERRKTRLSDEFVNRANEMLGQGLTAFGVAKAMKDEGWRDNKGVVVGYQIINKHIAKPMERLRKVVPGAESAVQRYIRENTEEKPLNYRLKISVFYEHYRAWCEKHNLTPVSSFRLTSNLPNKVRSSGELKGVIIKGRNLHTTVKVVKESRRTRRLNEKLAEFCRREGLSFGAAMQKLKSV